MGHPSVDRIFLRIMPHCVRSCLVFCFGVFFGGGFSFSNIQVFSNKEAFVVQISIVLRERYFRRGRLHVIIGNLIQ